MQSSLYTDLQGVSKKGPRQLLHKSFDDCDVPPSHHVPQQHGWARKVLLDKGDQEAPACQHASVCAACGASQLLHCTAAMLVLHPNCQAHHKSVNVKFTKADLASHVLRMCPLTWQDQFNLHEKGMTPMDMYLLLTSLKDRACMYAGKVQRTIRQESFQQGGERKQATWYWFYYQSPQESSYQEALQPLQEAWVRTYYAQYKRLL
jgi:hypothetical protein